MVSLVLASDDVDGNSDQERADEGHDGPSLRARAVEDEKSSEAHEYEHGQNSFHTRECKRYAAGVNALTDTDVRRLEDKVDGLALILARLEGSLTPTLTTLGEAQADHETRLRALEDEAQDKALVVANEDHEKRLRSIEKFRYAVPSLSTISLLISIAAVVVLYLTSH